MGLLLCIHEPVPVLALSQGDLRSEAATAFAAVSRAEAAGGNVTRLVGDLDRAVRLIDAGGEADLVEADALIRGVEAAASSVESGGAQSRTMRYVETGFVLVVLAAAAALVWLYGSRVFWRLWIRTKRGWRVEQA